jgi:ATP-binding cassette subfamily C protein CydD
MPRRLLAQHAGDANEHAAETRGLRTEPALLQSHAGWSIRFDHVSFAYDDGQRPALKDFSLHIPQGKKIALVGATGAGKTTVANLLLRFIEPHDGSITIDGTPLSDIDSAAWRSQVAWVPQQPHLFYGTIADNILLARPAATQDEVSAAAAAAHAHEFIEKLPQGYATPIGEQGVRLSGGQQQRLHRASFPQRRAIPHPGRSNFASGRR